ncbi:hypothetical protein EJ04DRAFT_288269 [Polyplosphaeria fusca]|uniref:Uncharacterized protein n=1 Tax=Polyplosphaeria fusca TaxID=682080 RepID=A0A9P4V8P8_9PLEO|nr:hypothetical protein EJ04DRAFT_288269 [Polyplosphaeria fusca]
MKPYQATLILFFGLSRALPAPQPQASGVSDPEGPPGSSGSLRGSESLLGFDSSNSVPKEPSTVIPPDQFEVAPGQAEDPKLGLYIDLSTVKNPQPLQGSTTGPTDPGPRYVITFWCLFGCTSS